MDNKLVTIRIKSFFIELGSLVGISLLGVLFSPPFQALLQTYTGESFFGSMIFLVVMGGVKHLRNLNLIKKLKADSLSGDSRFDPDSVLFL